MISIQELGDYMIADLELRTKDSFNEIWRYQATIGGDYKINSFLKAGLGYVYIDVKNSSDQWNPRHRLYLDLTGTLKSGDWRFSLKEKLQLTHSSGTRLKSLTYDRTIMPQICIGYKYSF